MPTLMNTETFGELARIRSALAAGPLTPQRDESLAGTMVPWAGSRLMQDGGIYYVGMATAGDYMGDEDPPTFDAQLRLAQSLCAHNRNLAGSPFWQFLDGLTWALLGSPFDEAADRWGWSNLLKIGWSSKNNPLQWPQPLIEEQRHICIRALYEEFTKLRHSLVVIVSRNEFGIAHKCFQKMIPQWKDEYNDNLNCDYNEQTGVWWFTEPNSGNLYVHCDHPNYAKNARFWGSALGRTINLARTLLPCFA